MARERMVTRTVEMTQAQFMACNPQTAEVTYPVYDIPGAHTAITALDYAKKHLSDGIIFVVCQYTNTYEVLYGMPESEFIQRAKVLPPRTKTE